MRSTYRALAYLIAFGVALQAASVALGFFTILHEVEDGGIFATGYDYESNLGIMIHRYVGLGLIPLSALVLLVLSFFLGAPGALRWAAAVFGLVVLQIALVFVAFSVAWGGALHGFNALAVFLAALWAGRRIGKAAPAREATRATAAAAQLQ